jgi:hypothetical protein
VHFVIDSAHAEVLQREWDAQQGLDLPLELVDCPDRRLPRAALELVDRVLGSDESTQATVLLPRRSYGALLGRLLHDRTADDIAAAVSQVAGVAATIVPFDASRAPWRRVQHEAEAALASGTGDGNGAGSRREGAAVATMTAPEGCVPIAQAPHRRTAVLQGRIRSCEVSPISGSPALRCELVDSSGGVTLLFYGRRAIPGIEPGATVRVEGRVGDYRGHLAMANPIYRLLPRDGAVPAT